jgi:DNA-binding transcriptional LysR family regulator
VITLEQLDTMRAVVRAGSFTRAADALSLSQSAVSQRVKQLERAVGAPVFERGAHSARVHLTPVGELVFAFANRVADGLDALDRDIARALACDDGDVLTLVCGTAHGRYLLPALLAAYRTRFPNVRVDIVHAYSDQLNDVLRVGRADIGIQALEFVDPDISQSPFFTDRVMLVGPARLDLPAAVDDRPRWLAQQPVVLPKEGTYLRIEMDRWARLLGVELLPVLEVNSFDTIKEAVHSGLGFAALPEYVLVDLLNDGSLQQIEMPGMPWPLHMRLVTCATRPLSPATLGLIAVARDPAWRSCLPGRTPATRAIE